MGSVRVPFGRCKHVAGENSACRGERCIAAPHDGDAHIYGGPATIAPIFWTPAERDEFYRMKPGVAPWARPKANRPPKGSHHG